MSDEKGQLSKDFDQERMFVFRMLPREVIESFTKEETLAFLKGEELPESMEEKLKDYLVNE